MKRCEDMMRTLTINEYGSFVGLEGDLLVVRVQGQRIEIVAIRKIDQLILYGAHTAISSAAILACAVRGISIVVCDGLGRIQAVLNTPARSMGHKFHDAQHAFCMSARATAFLCGLLRDKFIRQQLWICDA